MKAIHTMNISEWHTVFRSCTAVFSEHIKNLDFVKSALSAIVRVKPELTPQEEHVFDLHAHLHILMLLVNVTPDQASRHGSFIGFHTHTAITEVQELIASSLRQQRAASVEAYCPQLFAESVSIIRGLMLQEAGEKAYFSAIYFGLWRNWTQPGQHGATLYAQELQLLQTAKDKLGFDLSRYPWLTAQAWMLSFLYRDQEALELFTEINSSLKLRPDDLFRVLEAISEEKEWPRLSEWLLRSTPLMTGKRMNSLDIFYQYWDQLIPQHSSAEQHMWEPLFQLSPSLYEKKLLVHGKWKLWIDYQISLGTDPFEYRVSVFAPIEKNSPELLLPFYHQAVESNVLLKNRGGYKAAVKLLKRLAKLYKKLKEEQRWEAFIDAFASRHSRLRALQEELRKGKLIT
ncbi:hypothetical protein AB4Z29_27085 [Paenibacillus sp. 2TAB23]|uniref:SWIM zinc finger family protein n=1 Tax=Paenibacillus sp. 2TAB23 TaxID=3233004 RepID=UPI003F946CF2